MVILLLGEFLQATIDVILEGHPKEIVKTDVVIALNYHAVVHLETDSMKGMVRLLLFFLYDSVSLLFQLLGRGALKYGIQEDCILDSVDLIRIRTYGMTFIFLARSMYSRRSRSRDKERREHRKQSDKYKGSLSEGMNNPHHSSSEEELVSAYHCNANKYSEAVVWAPSQILMTPPELQWG